MNLDEMIAIHIEQLAYLREEKERLKKQIKENRQNTERCLATLKALQAQKEGTE